MNTARKTFNNYIDALFDEKGKSIYFIFILSALIVLPNIDRESLWLDEIYSATASLKVSSIYVMFTDYIFNDVHPPLYQSLLYFWGKITSGSDFEIRLLSYIFILVSFSASYFLLKKYYTKKIAILFVAISAFNPAVVYYAQEARSYALLYGLTNILVVLFYIIINNIRDNKKIEKNFLITYAILGVLVCYTHLFGYIIIFSLSSVALLYSVGFKRKNITASLFAASVFMAVMGVAWLLIHFNYGVIADKTQGGFWVKNNFPGNILSFRYLFLGNSYGEAGFAIAFIGFILSPSAFMCALKKYLVILFPAILVIVTALLVSFHTPIITQRNLIVIIPLVILFMTLIFDEMYNQKKIFIMICISFFVASSVESSSNYQKQNWKDASQYIENNFDHVKCKIPTRSTIDTSTGQEFLMYPKYYLGDKFVYSANGPELQDSCKLIYFDGHVDEKEVRTSLAENNITASYDILDFNRVFIVIKK